MAFVVWLYTILYRVCAYMKVQTRHVPEASRQENGKNALRVQKGQGQLPYELGIIE